MTCDNIYCNQGRNCTCTGLNQRNSDGSDPDMPVTMCKTFSWLQSLFAAIVRSPDIFEARRKQKMLSINGHEFPEPMLAAPKVGQTYWLVNPFSDTDDYKWEGDDYDKLWLSRGLCHTTREAAEAHRRAIILASGGTL